MPFPVLWIFLFLNITLYFCFQMYYVFFISPRAVITVLGVFLPSTFPASGSFPMSWLFASGGQSIRVSTSASVLPMNIQDWFPLGWTGLIFLQSKGLSRVFLLQHHNSKASILLWCFFDQFSAFFRVQLSHLYNATGKTIALNIVIFVGKVMSLLFNTLTRSA